MCSSPRRGDTTFGANPALCICGSLSYFLDWLYRNPKLPSKKFESMFKASGWKDRMRLDQSQQENASEIKSAAGRRQRVSVLQMELVNCHPWSIGDGISITCNVHSTRLV